MSQFAVTVQEPLIENELMKGAFATAYLPPEQLNIVHDRAKQSMLMVRDSLNNVLLASSKLGDAPQKRAQLVLLYNKFHELHQNVQSTLPAIAVPARKLIQLAFLRATGTYTKEEGEREALKIKQKFSQIDTVSLDNFSVGFSETIRSAVGVMISAATNGGENLQALYDEVQAAGEALQREVERWDSEMTVNCRAAQVLQFHGLQKSHAKLKVVLFFCKRI